MNETFPLVLRAALTVFVAGFFSWLFVRILKRSEDPVRLLVKWAVTLLILGFMAWQIKPWAGIDPDFRHIALGMLCALALVAIWRHTIGEVVAMPFTMLYDGGGAEMEPKPFYSVAQAKRKQGKYGEAIAEVRRQLERFPTDVEGQMLLAEIQVEHLNDLPGAELTIQRLLAQSGHAPANLAFALNSLADWHLKYALDREAARLDLEKIIALLPDSEWALAASQRIAHLANTEQMLDPHNRRRFEVVQGVQDLGLVQARDQPLRVEVDPARQAAGYVKHLETHPLDGEVREKLAALYADHYQRLDLAADQLEQLIAVPNQPAKHVAHWLNLLADLQIRHGAGYDAARATLQRIVDLFPEQPAATLAQNRIERLRLETKGNEKSQAVKLGSYEQDIGLKQNRPRS